MKPSHFVPALFMLAAGTAAESQSTPDATTAASSKVQTMRIDILKYTVFYPLSKSGKTDSTDSSHDVSVLGMMSPEAPPDTELGKDVAKCVNSRGGDDAVTGLAIVHAEDDEDAEYCITGWHSIDCKGQHAWAAMEKSEDKPEHWFDDYLIALYNNYTIGVNTIGVKLDQLESYEFVTGVPFKAISIEKGKCPLVKNE